MTKPSRVEGAGGGGYFKKQIRPNKRSVSATRSTANKGSECGWDWGWGCRSVVCAKEESMMVPDGRHSAMTSQLLILLCVLRIKSRERAQISGQRVRAAGSCLERSLAGRWRLEAGRPASCRSGSRGGEGGFEVSRSV